MPWGLLEGEILGLSLSRFPQAGSMVVTVNP